VGGGAALTVALVADTHGHLDPGIAELVQACDCAVHAGDIGDAGVLAELRPRRGVLVAVRGNNDVESKWPAAQHHTLRGLPREGRLELPGGLLVVVHGDRAGPAAGRHGWLRRRYPEARAVVYGHSHRQIADREGLPWVLNPGAAGRARTAGGPSCLVLRAGSQFWELVCHRLAPAAGPVRPGVRGVPGRRAARPHEDRSR
jgi:hypothetical protein